MIPFGPSLTVPFLLLSVSGGTEIVFPPLQKGTSLLSLTCFPFIGGEELRLYLPTSHSFLIVLFNSKLKKKEKKKNKSILKTPKIRMETYLQIALGFSILNSRAFRCQHIYIPKYCRELKPKCPPFPLPLKILMLICGNFFVMVYK